MGRVTHIFTQMWENGVRKVPENFFWPAEGGKVFFSTPVSILKMLIFVENLNMGEKHKENFEALA